MVFKKYEERLSTLWAVAVPFALGGVFLTGLGLVLEPYEAISWNGTFVASWLYATLVGTALAWVLWLGLVRAGEPGRVLRVLRVARLDPHRGAVSGRSPKPLARNTSPSLAIGAALVVSGIYLVNRQSREEKKA